MKKKSIFNVTLFVFLSIFSVSLEAKTLWQDSNPYSPENRLNIGDVILVEIDDLSKMKFTFKIRGNKKSEVNSSPDMTITGFLPKVGATSNTNSDKTIDFSHDGRLNLLMSTRITGKTGNKFNITGSRTYQLNGQLNRIVMTGLLDPVFLKGRKIESRYISDIRINIRSTEREFNLKRQALKGDEKAAAELTEQEKQQILIDYLQKMLGELTR